MSNSSGSDRPSFDFGIGLPHSLDPFVDDLRPQSTFGRYGTEEAHNSYNYRCDDFKKEHNGLHVLFSGCSVTFGEGLNLEEMWARMVYDEITKIQNTSGYFNLAVPGSSISFIVMRLFKYFKKFGNPDILFLNLPPVHRFLSVMPGYNDPSLDVVTSVPDNDGELDEKSLLIAAAVHFELYSILQSYCEQAGIKLISFTWQSVYQGGKDFISTLRQFKRFNTFHDIHKMFGYDQEIKQVIADSIGKEKSKDLEVPFFFARDGIHPGVFDNTFFAKSALKLMASS